MAGPSRQCLGACRGHRRTIGGIGTSFVNFGASVVDPGANWQVTGDVASALGAVSALSLSKATPRSRSTERSRRGSISALGGAGSKIDLADFSGEYLQGFNGTIGGLAVSSSTTPVNQIELAGVVASHVTRAVLSGNTITVQEGAATVATLTLSRHARRGSARRL